MKKFCFPVLFVLIISLSIPSQAQHKLVDEKFYYDSTLVDIITELIVKNLDSIKTEYYKIDSFKDYPFQTASLFILSGVMINDWQFTLIKDRTEHTDSISIIDFSTDSLIYKNQTEKIGKYSFGLYGSNTKETSFITINKTQLEDVFQISVSENLLTAKERILDELIRYSNEENFFLPENKIAGFNELGLMQREIVSVPILTKDDYNSLYKVASLITDDLIKILNSCVNQEPYNNYKRLVTATTDRLIELGYIKIPGPRNFNYIIKE